MGAVYAARDPELDRNVAIKVLHLGKDQSERQTERLLREGRALARLTHPNVVTVFDVGRHDGSVFIAMELIDGPTLRDWLTPLVAWKQRVEVFLEAGRGLAAVHDCGLLHLDFKPSNVMIDASGRVRLADFGLAAGDLDNERSDSAADSIVDSAEVDISRVRGTPDYMAPEQQAGKVTAAADQFAFCVSLYEALCGRHPFGKATTAVERLTSIAMEEPSPLDASGLPPRIGQALARGLARNPEDRWPTLPELLDELEAALNPKRTSRWIAVGGAVVISVGALTWVTNRGSQAVQCPTAEAKLAQIWSDADERELSRTQAAFEVAHGGLPEGLAPALEHKATEWSRAWSAACEAAQKAAEEQVQEANRVLDCLGAQQVAIEGTIDLFLGADDATLVRGLGIVQELDPPSSCTDDGPFVPPPPPDQRAAVAEVRAQLERAKLERRAGHPKEAIAIGEAAMERAEAIGYAPLSVEVLLECGDLHSDLQVSAQAEPLLERAAWLALESGDERAAVAAFIALVGAGRAIDRIDETLDWAQRARSLLEQQEDHVAEAQLEAKLSFAMWNLGRVTEALEHAERARTISATMPEELELAEDTSHVLAIALTGTNLEKAKAVAERLVASRSARFGPLHPRTASSQMVLATILGELGRAKEAVELHDGIIESMLFVHGRQSRLTAAVYNNRASAYTALGRYDEAVADFELAAAIWDELGNLDSSVYAYSGLARTKAAQGDFGAMRKHASHAWELIVATPSGQHSLRWEVAGQLAQAAEAQDDPARAWTWWKEALDASPPTDLDRAQVHAGLAGVAQDPEAAASQRELAKAALQAAEPVPAFEAERVKEIRASLSAGSL